MGATLWDTALVVLAAGSAPSVHNTQPWQFSIDGDSLLLSADPGRALWVSDPTARALYISCGAAVFSARVAFRALGYQPHVRLLPQPQYASTVLAVIEPAGGHPPAPADNELYEALWLRRTNRRPFAEKPVPQPVLGRLRQAADQEDASLRVLDQPEASLVLTLATEAGRELAADPEHQAELRQWIAGRQQADISADDLGDRIPIEALPLQPDRIPWPVRGDFVAAAPEHRARARYEQSPQIAVLSTANDEPEDWLRAGQALQHVLLVATACGLSASFLYHVISRDDMHGEESQQWPWPENRQMIIRLGFGESPVPVPRRPLADIMPAIDGPWIE